jgi:hypothetical protein
MNVFFLGLMVSDLGAFQILDFQVRDAQPVIFQDPKTLVLSISDTGYSTCISKSNKKKKKQQTFWHVF